MSAEPALPSLEDMSGRVAVVTGAAQGIGAAVAHRVASAGGALAACDRDGARLEDVARSWRRLGAAVETGVLDVRDVEAADDFVQRAGRRFGRIDVLVANAGGGFAAPFLEVSTRGEDALVRENFTSVTGFVRAVVPWMPPPGPGRTGGGSVVMITSIEAHRAGPGFAVYAAMKAAVANLAKSLALELADRHIRVNCVAPDVIPTPGIGEIPVRTPLPYAGSADDVAAAVAYLVSPAAGFVTGTTIHVDGGNHAAGGWHRVDGRFRASPP